MGMDTSETETQNVAERATDRSLLWALLIVIASVAMFGVTYHGPSALPPDAPSQQFSAGRAIKVLEELLGDGQPHPAGTAENDAVRNRLVEKLESLDLPVELVPFESNGVSMCNVISRIAGNENVRPLLLATHYDSVESGPGAGDAGSCVGSLVELARILVDEPQESGCDIYLLFTDGEEWVRDIGHGLNGAEHFVASNHEVLSRNPLVFNFDARGAAGPALMYETSGNNLGLVQKALPLLPNRAFTASSYVTVYDLLPNATDFTIFKEAGFQGLNFAFIDDPHRYHTPEDTVANLDPRSVQHHGENALALVRGFCETSGEDPAAEQNAVFFTIGGYWRVAYPERYAVWLAAILVMLQLAGVRAAIRRGLSVSEIVRGIAALLLVLAVVVGVGECFQLGSQSRPQSFHGFGSYDPLIVAGLWIGAFVAAWITVRLTCRNAEQTWYAVWIAESILGLAVAAWLPGFSYLFLTVGFLPAMLGLLPLDKRRLSIISVAAAAVILVPIGWQFGIALGPKMALVLSGLIFFMIAPLFPLMTRTR